MVGVATATIGNEKDRVQTWEMKLVHDSWWGRIHQSTGLVRGIVGVALQRGEVHDGGMTYNFLR